MSGLLASWLTEVNPLSRSVAKCGRTTEEASEYTEIFLDAQDEADDAPKFQLE